MLTKKEIALIRRNAKQSAKDAMPSFMILPRTAERMVTANSTIKVMSVWFANASGEKTKIKLTRSESVILKEIAETQDAYLKYWKKYGGRVSKDALAKSLKSGGRVFI